MPTKRNGISHVFLLEISITKPLRSRELQHTKSSICNQCVSKP